MAIQRRLAIGHLAIVLAAALVFSAGAGAAPLPPFPPVDICGHIASAKWQPAEEKAGEPGMSGTLGHDRVFPARYSVVLSRYTGIDAATAARINGLLAFDFPGITPAPGELFLLIASDDDELLVKADSFCVEKFRIDGDEGGTWTFYDRLKVHPR